MEARVITCRSVGVYNQALIRGNKYTIKDEVEDKYRITGNHGKAVWISKNYFIEGNIELPILKTWSFDDDLRAFDLVEVTLTFSDRSKRWCLITTPERLVNHFKQDIEPPGFNIRHLIITKTMGYQDINKTLNYLDSNDELLEASKPLE